MITKIKAYFERKTNLKIVLYIVNNINLEIIEFAKNKHTQNITNNKEFKKIISESIRLLIETFSYKKLSYFLESASTAKTVKVELNKFLTNHAKYIYKKFNMDIYKEYQTREKNEILELILVEKCYINEKKTNAVLIIYKDDRNMVYDTKTGLRTVIELISTNEETAILTLVDHNKQNKVSRFSFMEIFLK